jgi:hypothetical protein
MPDSVHVYSNDHEAGRAHVVAHTPSGATSIDIDLSLTGLVNGQAYSIKNAFNYFGDEVASGTYDSGDPEITVSLTAEATDVATPIGMGSTPATTVPDFAVFIVVPGEAVAEVIAPRRNSIFQRFR